MNLRAGKVLVLRQGWSAEKPGARSRRNAVSRRLTNDPSRSWTIFVDTSWDGAGGGHEVLSGVTVLQCVRPGTPRSLGEWYAYGGVPMPRSEWACDARYDASDPRHWAFLLERDPL